ncbi:CDP-diacylglycerol--serine O-phosphatidyltransferase [Pseudomonas sp. R5(2019)]|uniref:CDP-diacylglycerol--serine O-phosphatidyltransferase n=1 Tax=Pseudomonas sp. R5(2019) TaxID=2697566 RepID=UPI0014121C52|nr:CDP-diacylglycerol--serine O-phosphatidyltransferase [Pseudomonas sp. R5(2019)]NBA97133.1 CDP-diacylglycerol--serine O-phosphatidyltransferase [Pseudomonas sp. R5(2019)]
MRFTSSATLQTLRGFELSPRAITIVPKAAHYRQRLLDMIAAAERRIVIVALYLQQDEAGQEILDALYRAKAARPVLDIVIVVDWFRAQRGLIGAGKQPGNSAWYCAERQRQGLDVPIYGVPVQTRELFGVLHLKGSVIDDCVIYSGASLNNVYLHKFDKYRLDRYHLIHSKPLADAFQGLVQHVLDSKAANRLDLPSPPTSRSLRADIRQLRTSLKRMAYETFQASDSAEGLRVIPLLGVGKQNPLNRTICQLVAASHQRLTLCTPYFNPPRVLIDEINRALVRGVVIDIIVGDKIANDFYVPPEQPFSVSSVLPYLYEKNLRNFAQKHQQAIAERRLNLFVWNDPGHSYHSKGIWVDERYTLLTGNNLNPRGFRLDLENALLIDDPKAQWAAERDQELEQIKQHVSRVEHFDQLQAFDEYPKRVRRFLQRVRFTRIERLLYRML